MEKSLEKIKEIIDFCDAVGCHRAIYESIKFVEKELEEAMKHKTCGECVAYDKDGNCKDGVRISNVKGVPSSFYCKWHEPKDTQC